MRCSLTFEFVVLILANDFYCYSYFSLCTTFCSLIDPTKTTQINIQKTNKQWIHSKSVSLFTLCIRFSDSSNSVHLDLLKVNWTFGDFEVKTSQILLYLKCTHILITLIVIFRKNSTFIHNDQEHSAIRCDWASSLIDQCWIFRRITGRNDDSWT